jgi:GTP-binding protein Era
MDGQKKAAFVAVLGRPSVGKSTLVNAVCGQKVAIVSAVPQTTRNAIRGIYNGEQGQLVFVDTPGRHHSEKKFNKKLISVSDRSMAEADIVLYVLDATRPPGPEEEAIVLALAPFAGKIIAAINKIDSKDADAGGLKDFLGKCFPPAPGFEGPLPCVEISALEGRGIEELLVLLFNMAPRGEAFYPEDYYTDQEVSFRIAEIIREKAVQRLREELPHSIYVDVADLEFRGPGAPADGSGGGRLWARAFIVTERESQKGMVVGKGGAMIKAIRQAAQKDLDAIFDWKVDLDLRVKCAKDWRHNDVLLKRLIDR